MSNFWKIIQRDSCAPEPRHTKSHEADAGPALELALSTNGSKATHSKERVWFEA
jgi:hypothetical protein